MRSMGENIRKDVSNISKSFPKLWEDFALPAFIPAEVGTQHFMILNMHIAIWSEK